MQRFSIALIGLLVLISVSLLSRSRAGQPELSPPGADLDKAVKEKIVPVVMLKPGETKELLLSTWCTVGITRSGGLSLREMKDDRPKFVGDKSYDRDGVKITVPDYAEAEKYSGSATFAPLRKKGISVFKVTVTASKEANPGFFDMHLRDDTCAGDCVTDFRVLVVQP